jgi:MFS family permease
VILTPKYGKVEAASIAAGLYLLRNVIEAISAYPIGVLSDRSRRTWLLAAGYMNAAAIAGAAAVIFYFETRSVALLAAIFVASGVFAACKETLEGAIPAAMITEQTRGTAYGALGFVNGFGDLAASALTGMIWSSISPAGAFGVAAIIMLAGALLMATV